MQRSSYVGIRRIQQKGTFAGVQVDVRNHPEVYDEYVRLAGNELKDPGRGDMGARDYLNSVVSGTGDMSQIYREHYRDGEDGSRIAFIRNTISSYRKLAQERIMSEANKWAEFIAYVNKR